MLVSRMNSMVILVFLHHHHLEIRGFAITSAMAKTPKRKSRTFVLKLRRITCKVIYVWVPVVHVYIPASLISPSRLDNTRRNFGELGKQKTRDHLLTVMVSLTCSIVTPHNCTIVKMTLPGWVRVLPFSQRPVLPERPNQLYKNVWPQRDIKWNGPPQLNRTRGVFLNSEALRVVQLLPPLSQSHRY